MCLKENRLRINTTVNLIVVATVVGCAICYQAGAATGWAQANYSATVATHFGAVAQAQSTSEVLVLNHDGAATIQASVVSAGDEVLTSVTSDSLTTSYKLTGAVLGGTADGDWVASADFIHASKSYSVTGVGPSNITFWVRGASAANRANDAGAYTGSVILTVTW